MKSIVERLWRRHEQGILGYDEDQYGPLPTCADAAKTIDQLRSRLLESDALLSGILGNESLPEHARATVIEQMQDNQRTLDQ